MPGYNEADEGSGDSGVIATSGPSRDAVKKLDQIIQVNTPAILSSLRECLHYCPQNFHTKAAIVVLQSRMPLPVILTKDGTKKVNKWVCLQSSTLKEHPQANSSFISFK
jgi:autophagy-related protein 13